MMNVHIFDARISCNMSPDIIEKQDINIRDRLSKIANNIPSECFKMIKSMNSVFVRHQGYDINTCSSCTVRLINHSGIIKYVIR